MESKMDITLNFRSLHIFIKTQTVVKKTFGDARFPSDPGFCCLLVKAAFLLGLLNLSGGVLIEASQRQGGPIAAHPSPWVCMKGGLGRPQPVLLPLFTKGLGAGWTTPLSTPQYNGKQGSGKILETRTHTCHSLDLGGSTSYYLGDTRKRKRGWGGELVSNSGWFLNGYEEEEEAYEKA